MKKSSVLKVSGNIFGTALQYNLIAAGIVIGGIAVLAGKKRTGKVIKEASINIGRFAGKAVRISGKVAGVLIDAASNEGVQLGRTIGDKVIKSRVRIYGDVNEFIDKEKIIEINNKIL